MDDAGMWKRISDEDAEAFEAFYREYGSRARAFLRHSVAGERAAEDIMQNTFTEISRRPPGFDTERGTLCAYLFGIARKQAAE